ncbi:MAG: DUF4271 domain-containing protein [Ferruginibacter sp.]
MKQVFFFFLCMIVFSTSLCAQNTDSTIVKTDSLQSPLTDSLKPPVVTDTVKNTVSIRPAFKLQNKLLNTDATPVSVSVQLKKGTDKDSLFYLITGIVLLLAFCKYLYSRYFTNLFRVFFNTSLRQSQLTDQLLQAKLPSLVFNLFFVISGGVYLYILLIHYHVINEENKWLMILSSIALLGLIYLVKFCTLKFTGWVTGLTDITNIYAFVIFLINKIIGIFLVPFIVILSFSDVEIVKIAGIISLMSIGIFLLLRFFRSYGLLQNQLKISRFHFILYIAGIELLPLLLIYKGLMVYLSKNL